MWTVVYMAQNKAVVTRLHHILEAGGVLVRIRPINKKSESDDYYEVLVPQAEVEEAHNLIIEAGF